MDANLMGQMDWTAVGTIALAIVTFALVIETYQTMNYTRRQSEIREKKKDLMEKEEAYSKFMGFKLSAGLFYQHLLQSNSRIALAGYSQETRDNVHDMWLLAITQSHFEAEKEFYIFNRTLGEILGLINTRFEYTDELNGLIFKITEVQNEYLDNFIYKAPPEGLNFEEINKWTIQLADKFPEFDATKLDQVLGTMLTYLTNEINKLRIELAK
jgi:hypothetical protein